MVKVWRSAILLYIGGIVYVLLEMLWRGWSHPSMFLVGGLCFVIIGELNGRLLAWNTPFVELAAGLILNVQLKLNVWDYAAMPLNFKGQICLPYFLLWIPLSAAAIFADDWLRHVLFGEAKPAYRWI